MTAGQDALREAARLEAARVYGGVVPECHNAPAGLGALTAEAELQARAERVSVTQPPDALGDNGGPHKSGPGGASTPFTPGLTPGWRG